MSQMERIYKLDRLFRRKRPPSKHEILDMFEISPAQFKRDLEYMRNRLGAPVTFDMPILAIRHRRGPKHLFPDTEVIEYVCNENEKDLEHMVGK